MLIIRLFVLLRFVIFFKLIHLHCIMYNLHQHFLFQFSVKTNIPCILQTKKGLRKCFVSLSSTSEIQNVAQACIFLFSFEYMCTDANCIINSIVLNKNLALQLLQLCDKCFLFFFLNIFSCIFEK